MNKKTKKKAEGKNIVEMPLVNAHAAGIDISDKEHVVAVPEGSAAERVRKFGTMTCDLEAIVVWLKSCLIETVAMESTGVYWKSLFSVLVRNGFEVYLVNAKHVKNVTGKKTDEDDAMWIQKLHSCGLLKSSYLPDDEQETLRTLVRFRRTLIQDSSRFINRMQKSLELMNIKFHTVISDITGQTGRAVIEAIIAGERNAANFLPLINVRIKANHETIRQSLEGTWRKEHLFTLKENYEIYKMYQQRIAVCDKEIEQQLQCYEAKCNEGEIQTKERVALPAAAKKKKDKNHPPFDVRAYLQRILGVDVLAIPGLSETGGLEILSETGADPKKAWPQKSQFNSWMTQCPNNKISGGKVISSRLMKKKPNAASQAFRRAANSLQKSDNGFGQYFRRMKAKGGHKYAVIATANKLSTVYYIMVTEKKEYDPKISEQYEQKHTLSKIAYYEKKLNELQQRVA